MPQLIIPDIDEGAYQRLTERATHHGRSAELEAKAILTDVLKPDPQSDPWATIDAIRTELAASGRDFGDSTESIREDRAR